MLVEYKEGKIKIAGVVEESITDGIGIRYVIFTQVCKHNCPNCHNPESHSSGGSWVDIDRIVREVKDDPLLKGITISGGEPMLQPQAVIELCKRVKDETSLDIWLYSGYTINEIQRHKYGDDVLNLIDVLVDGRYVEELKDEMLRFKGSSNQNIIYLDKGKKI